MSAVVQTAPASATLPAGVRRILLRSAGWIVVILLLTLWQIAGTLGRSATLIPFTDALGSLWALLTGPALTADIIPSLLRVFAGYTIAGVTGVTVGLIFGMTRWLDPWVHPLISFTRSIPPALIIPLALLVLGLGPQLVIAVVAFGALWPVLLNTFDAARRIDPLYLDVARAAKISPTQRLWRVVLPACLPMIMAGLRISLGISLILMVVSEVLASSSGLGFRMNYAQQSFDVAGTYGAVLLLAILGWLFDVLFVSVEQRVLRWHPAFQGGKHA